MYPRIFVEIISQGQAKPRRVYNVPSRQILYCMHEVGHRLVGRQVSMYVSVLAKLVLEIFSLEHSD